MYIYFGFKNFCVLQYAFDAISKESLFNPRSQRFLSYVSSGSFILLNYILKSMVHF